MDVQLAYHDNEMQEEPAQLDELEENVNKSIYMHKSQHHCTVTQDISTVKPYLSRI